MAYQRIEVLTGTERRRSYTPSQKVRMVDEAFRPGVVVSDAARRLGVHESLLYRWRRMMTPVEAAAEPGFAAVTILPEPVTEAAGLPVMPPLASPPPPLPVGVLEVSLPCGACLRLEGTVDPVLAAAVVRALTGATPS
jgi:transposase